MLRFELQNNGGKYFIMKECVQIDQTSTLMYYIRKQHLFNFIFLIDRAIDPIRFFLL